jgi:hypothetical protein
MDELVQTLPPLSQSDWKQMSCGESYVAIAIDGQGGGDSVPSERGRDVHNVLAKYIAYCASKGIPADWEEFNRLAAASGLTAGRILDGMRDSYVVDYDHSFDTELTLGLDEDFNPAYIVVGTNHRRYTENLNQLPGVEYSDKPVAFICTIDHLLFSDEGDRAKEEDFKSTPKIFEADDEVEGVQAILYAFVAFKHFPAVQRITFEFIFVRYTNSRRSIVFNRTQMPEMQTDIARARERQRIIHAIPEAALALPCKQCAYCPKAKNLTCSIADQNEWTTLTPEQRLMSLEFYRRMGEIHRPILREIAAVRGPVEYRDGNGRLYVYGPHDVAHTRYPLDASSITLLGNWMEATGENLLDGRLNISSTKIKQLLGTQKKPVKKRAVLREQFEESVIQTETKPLYSVRTPDEGVVDDYNQFTDQEE